MNSMFLETVLGPYVPWLYVESIVWTYVGLFGNALFTSRFLIQWIKSERQQKLVVPPIFWHLSFWGSLISLIYALHVDKLPVILGYAFLPLMYFRNLRILRKTQRAEAGGG
ncbi:MAG: lipid-A-disaccharide synthase N-terminal domain-containing protein [Verrucomicrobia bacterium]|nr:lipid-A-disaccharide synthase N-terminal domain-containing protein [Verrucomicrobiota bacterium]